MNLKLIQEDNLTGEIIAINPKIKKVTLEYEIIQGEIGDYGLDKAKWRLGIEPYNKLLKDLYNIDYITEEEAEALMEDRERTEEEKEEVKKYFSSIIGKENLNHLLNAIKENISIYIYLLTASFMLNVFLITRIILFSKEIKHCYGGYKK